MSVALAPQKSRKIFAGPSHRPAARPVPVQRQTPRSPAKTAAAAYGFTLIPTAWGPAGVAWRTAADGVNASAQPRLARIILPGMTEQAYRKSFAAHAAKLQMTCQEMPTDASPEWLGELAAHLAHFYDPRHAPAAAIPAADLWERWRPRLHLAGLTDFQLQVLALVAAIPPGHTRTYGEIARQLHRPGAARGVGGVMRTNRWPVLVPCHRVVGSNGAMTGFTAPGGVKAKRCMLELEQEMAGMVLRKP